MALWQQAGGLRAGRGLVIGLAIVAASTSLPGIATRILACLRGERDIAPALSWAATSATFLAALGLSSTLAPQVTNVPEATFRLDIPVMLAVVLACLPIFSTGNLLARREDALFLGYDLAYTPLSFWRRPGIMLGLAAAIWKKMALD